MYYCSSKFFKKVLAIVDRDDAYVPITYFRIPKVDHYGRKHPDVVEQSFAWLATQIGQSSY